MAKMTSSTERPQVFLELQTEKKRHLGGRTEPYACYISETEFKTNKGRWFFTQWVVNLSNSLPKDVVAAKNLLDLKKSLEKLTEEKSS